MQHRLAIIFDSSGSLKEYHREVLLNYLLSLIVDSLIYFKVEGVEYSFYTWNEQVNEIEHTHKFNANGKSSLVVLAQKMKELSQNGTTAFLIITDGDFHQELEEYKSLLSDFEFPISAALVGAGDTNVLSPLTKYCVPFSADSLPVMLKVFPMLYQVYKGA